MKARTQLLTVSLFEFYCLNLIRQNKVITGILVARDRRDDSSFRPWERLRVFVLYTMFFSTSRLNTGIKMMLETGGTEYNYTPCWWRSNPSHQCNPHVNHSCHNTTQLQVFWSIGCHNFVLYSLVKLTNILLSVEQYYINFKVTTKDETFTLSGRS